MDRLEEMQQRHKAIARYSVAIQQRGLGSVLFSGLRFDAAQSVCDQLQDELIASIPGGVRFTTPVHIPVLENFDETLTPEALERIRFIRNKKGQSHHG